MARIGEICYRSIQLADRCKIVKSRKQIQTKPSIRTDIHIAATPNWHTDIVAAYAFPLCTPTSWVSREVSDEEYFHRTTSPNFGGR